MRSRELLLLLALGLILATGAAVMLTQQESPIPVDLGNPSGPPIDPPPAPDPQPNVDTNVGTAEADLSGGDQISSTAAADLRKEQTAEWTHGVILGDIPLTASIIPEIETISVYLNELKNYSAGGARPVQRVLRVPYQPGDATPTFEIRDVPFSAYGYTVRVHSPGLNGGQATVNVTEDNPVTNDLKLPITPGAPYSLRFQDQDFKPIAFTEVRMLPVGEPVGRPSWMDSTDNYGTVVFDKVLAGNYEILIGPAGQPLQSPPPVVTVQPGAVMRVAGAIQPQGQVLTVPRGTPLEVRVSTYGQPLQGVRIRALNTDRRQRTEVTVETDARGTARFANLVDGTWQIDAYKLDYQHSTRQRTVKRDAPPPKPVEFTLRRLR